MADHCLHVPEVEMVVQSCPVMNGESNIHHSACRGRDWWTGLYVCLSIKRRRKIGYIQQRVGITCKYASILSLKFLIKFKNMMLSSVYSSI